MLATRVGVGRLWCGDRCLPPRHLAAVVRCMELLGDDDAVDALIREEESRVRQFKLFHCTDEERRRQYGAVSRPMLPEPSPSPPKVKLTGIPLEMLPVEAEEMLVHEYEQHRSAKHDVDIDLRRRGLPPPYYDGPLLTLRTRGPYTRFEVLACRPPMRPRVEGKKASQKDCSQHYPRPLREKPKEDTVAMPGDSLRRWKYSMGLLDE
ncbi:hypothetical protein TcCL_NonESM00189 [Trypanosoma cruzi]|uniref:Uncharacterized protein n=2 Tax=Trypanosoma cruzi TaxID=5693 RepID=Q4CXM3_TRYCC|nr:hypothetical protein, conserved [Trypanosoma cruzi]EAN85023.1 hypothetical protein, conserved [Trypanosoma cruzi]RNC49866.1 hypothetical protein TcCL_NonESM00189 [Trypanosoma cruzi]|eukprot:XP_806874.1 hypothetical protein [Trypanosoma cruzi strain CL Brener]